MRYDVFISHASEDKHDFVRPLAQELRKNRVEVWYDEFSLNLGMSLRQSIDEGLAQSRYGIVVLSPNFFQKGWPEWELSGLVQRQTSSVRSIILPIWHNVNRVTVEKYSPPLASIKATKSAEGIPSVVEAILKILRPEGSSLLTARDIMVSRGYDPPIATDDWWLDVLEFSANQDSRRWFFPIWGFVSEAAHRGERIAWHAMQMEWQDAAAEMEISQLTPPRKVLQFIESQPGLIEACERMPERLAAYAPQLLFPTCGGRFARLLDRFLKQLPQPHTQQRSDLGNYAAHAAACEFVQGLPQAEVYDKIDYMAWFLSSASDWVPKCHHAFLFEGMKVWAAWEHWRPAHRVMAIETECLGTSHEFRMALMNAKTVDDLRTNLKAVSGLNTRLKASRHILGLPESETALTERFFQRGVIAEWIHQRRQK